jgi:hypothetical protein
MGDPAVFRGNPEGWSTDTVYGSLIILNPGAEAGTRTSMCSHDMCRCKKPADAAPKKQLKLRDLIHEQPSVEEVCACAHLEDAVECLAK